MATATTTTSKVGESTLLYKRFMMQEAIKDIGAAVTNGLLSNSAACDLAAAGESTRTGYIKGGGGGTASTPGSRALERMSYISAGDRLRKLQEGAKQMKRLFQEFTVMSEKSLSHGGEAAVAARAIASKEVFTRECGLEGNNDISPPTDTANPHHTVSAAQRKILQPAEDVEKQLQPVITVLNNVKALRRLPRFDYEKSLREAKQKGAASSLAAQHVHLIVKRLEETLSDAINAIRAKATTKPVSSQVVKDIALWPIDLLRLLNDALNQKTLDVLTESGREQLRRIAFDVEELQHDQQQAVTDGDMQKSEQLYFEQTTLLETMKPQFGELEGVMERYKKEKGEAAQESLRLYQRNFRQQMTSAIRREERDKKQTDGDAEKLTDKRDTIQKARRDQKANHLLYLSEWDRLFDSNTEQQVACYRAMEELERRIQHLASEQAVLITDRLEKVNTERQRALDAAAFYYFCDQRTKTSQEAAQTCQTSVDALKEVGAALEFSVVQFDGFLKECVVDHAEEELLALRQEKLTQFRQLYLTLGDLQFKKARHAEEIEKKIEYYSLQQEIAMDTLNPKAKEYSQAKKKWQCVQEEIHQQLNVLEKKSEKEAGDFKPTEQLLIQAGVEFRHPVDELREKNTVRQQKLLEYKQMMDSKVEEQHKKDGKDGKKGERPVSPGTAALREDDEVLLAERMNGSKNNNSSTRNPSLSMSRSAMRLQSSEEVKRPINPPTGSSKGRPSIR